MREPITMPLEQEGVLSREQSNRIASAYDAVRDELFDTGGIFNSGACMKLEAVEHHVCRENIAIPDDDDDLRELMRMIIMKDLQRLDRNF